MVFIINRHGQRVLEDRGGLFEPDAVFTAVGDGLVRVPLEGVGKRRRHSLSRRPAPGFMLENQALDDGFGDLLLFGTELAQRFELQA